MLWENREKFIGSFHKYLLNSSFVPGISLHHGKKGLINAILADEEIVSCSMAQDTVPGRQFRVVERGWAQQKAWVSILE